MQPDKFHPADPHIPLQTLGKSEHVVEKHDLADIPLGGTAFAAPQPILDNVDGLDDDELFPENFRGWLVVLGCFIMSSITALPTQSAANPTV
ncbi:hypothetical protein FS749_008954 [Ceratobasidium sp. UAMH 11750]|nr:hypothetical protein FS749_008954 [Ceratobasidium sp. UAMH 11750]